MSKTYLKIENPGVAPAEAFTLLGASTKRKSDNIGTIGCFGSGNKHAVSTLLRHKCAPIVYAGSLRLEFGTKPHCMDGHSFERVVVKFGGKDAAGSNRSSTEDLGFVLEYGAHDWVTVDLALREFVSNSLDRAVEEGETDFWRQYAAKLSANDITAARATGSAANKEWADAVKQYRSTATDFRNVVIEVVNESQVRARAGYTRVFVPLNEEVFRFFNNIDRWFLHFSEPQLLNCQILPKADRNLDARKAAVIYRRGVRVREFEASNVASLFDYNLPNLAMDESRKVDDWSVHYAAAEALAGSEERNIVRLFQSFVDGHKFWEHGFNQYGLENGLRSNAQKAVWSSAFEKTAGVSAVMAVEGGGDAASRKGYAVVTVPESFAQAAEKAGIRTPAKVLSDDDRNGREVLPATAAAQSAVDFGWSVIDRFGLTKGKQQPPVHCFRHIMEAGAVLQGFYRDGAVYLNLDLCDGDGFAPPSGQLLACVLEELAHFVTLSFDGARDFQNYAFQLAACCAKALEPQETT